MGLAFWKKKNKEIYVNFEDFHRFSICTDISDYLPILRTNPYTQVSTLKMLRKKGKINYHGFRGWRRKMNFSQNIDGL